METSPGAGGLSTTAIIRGTNFVNKLNGVLARSCAIQTARNHLFFIKKHYIGISLIGRAPRIFITFLCL